MMPSELLNTIKTARSQGVQRLTIVGKNIKALPPEIGSLTKITHLDISQNSLTVLPSEIRKLQMLKWLNVSDNELTELPEELGYLSVLQQLDLTHNQLTGLPQTIQNLSQLEELALSENPFIQIPNVIGSLANLQKLWLGNVKANTFPDALCNLSNLDHLWLNDNGLVDLPAHLRNLGSLRYINLSNNSFTQLPPVLGSLKRLDVLEVEGMDLSVPPMEIIGQGTQAIVGYLREWGEGSQQQWVSKVLIVGDGGVGKTSLLRRLRGDKYRYNEETTHGIYIQSLALAHPEKKNVDMELRVWDFGGQEIYFATHQFFLTDRSLFLLVWNARQGYEQCRVFHWLDSIRARAPSSPVLIVATHTDQRDADLPIGQILEKHKNVEGHAAVSNLKGSGIDHFREMVAKAASTLPLMGQTWPATWIRAATAVRTSGKRYVTPNELQTLLVDHEVSTLSWTTLAQWLHDLGEILYFMMDDELREIVILKPQWVSAYISRVLEDTEVITRKGIFTKREMDRIWSDLDLAIRAHFLLLMERFDLSYRTLEDKEISLVVERLPLDAPAYGERWDQARKEPNCREMSMKFSLNTLPAGIPTWFIARSHRFTTGTHWRTGAVFSYGPNQKHLACTSERTHLALVEAKRYNRCVTLTVRGPNPQVFFALLKDGFEVTLARFPGLEVKRYIPCPGHNDVKCTHEFDYVQLLTRYEKGRTEIECPVSLEQVNVEGLLFGLHWSTRDVVLRHLSDLQKKVDLGRREILQEVTDLRELTQVSFTKSFRREQSKIESYCPNIFVVRPRDRRRLRELQTNPNWWDPSNVIWWGWDFGFIGPAVRAIAGQAFQLQLYCQEPGCWHPVREGGLYDINDPPKWFRLMSPYIRRLVNVLKVAGPLVGPVAAFNHETYDNFKEDIDLMEKICEALPSVKEREKTQFVDKNGNITEREPEPVEGAALRCLREFLDKEDPRHEWGKLRRVLTPEDHYLWLCEFHAKSYLGHLSDVS